MKTKVIAGRPDGYLVDEIVVMPGLALPDIAVIDDGEAGHQLQRLIRTARTIVAEYARAGGLRDPEAIAEFSRSCVGRALTKARRRKGRATLCEEAMRVAVRRFGLGISRSLSQGQGRRAFTPAQKAAHRLAASPQNIFVPRQTPQAMPLQPLGELPPLIQPRAWRRLVGTAIGRCMVVAFRLRGS